MWGALWLGEPCRRAWSCGWAGLVLGLLPLAAAAQPGTLIPQASPIPHMLVPEAPSVGGLPSTIEPAAPAAVPATEVAVTSVAIEGASVYPPARLAPFTMGLVGPATKLAQIEAARVALLNLYRADGYVLSTVTASLDETGRLRFLVLEGRISDVKLDGEIGPAGVQVLRFLRHLTEQAPIDEAKLERWLLLAQDIPGISLHAVLRPSAETPGAMTLIAQVSRSAVSGLFTADNYAFQATGPEEYLAAIDFNSFTSLGERTELSLYQGNAGTQTFGQASEEFYVGDSGLRLRFYGGAGIATPSGELRAIGYQDLIDLGGLSATYPLLRSRQQSLTLGAYFDVEQMEILTNSGVGGASTRASFDALRVLRLGADYARQDLLLGGDRVALNTANARVSQGIPGLDGTTNSNPLPGRLGERVDFTKVNAEFTRTQTLFQPWSDATVALKGLVISQYTNNVLPPFEEFYLGGPNYTRGYFWGEAFGDRALAATAELDFNESLDVRMFGHSLPLAAQFYLFYDWGETWDVTPGDPHAVLRSAGVGTRLDLTQYVEFDVIGAERFSRTPFGTAGGLRPLSADAIYWQVLAHF